VPPEAGTVAFLAQSSEPINMDIFNDVGSGVGATGAPDLFASETGPNSVSATLTSREVPYGLWVLVPSWIGPYPSGAPLNVPFSTNAVALMQPFDAAISADSGDA